MYNWSELSFDEIDSPFALQEYLQELIRTDRQSIDRLLECPANQDTDLWQYEHLSMVCLELNYLVVQLDVHCSKESCPEMKADEWLYLCAAHPQPHSVRTLSGFDGVSAALLIIRSTRWTAQPPF
jgi:hypothetical protein